MTHEERAELRRRVDAARRAQLRLDNRLREMERLRTFLAERPGSTATQVARGLRRETIEHELDEAAREGFVLRDDEVRKTRWYAHP